MKAVAFVTDGMFYQITLNTDSARSRRLVADLFDRFLDAFAIVKKPRKLTPADRTAVLVSRYKRLAILYADMGNADEALKYVLQGLDVEPTNAELLKLESKLAAKGK